MKIPKRDLFYVSAMLLAASAGVTGVIVSECKAQKELDENVEYVKKNIPDKYEYLKERYGTTVGQGLQTGVWRETVKNHRDSLRNDSIKKQERVLMLDSIARTNYLKGSQAVRDSLEKVK